MTADDEDDDENGKPTATCTNLLQLLQLHPIDGSWVNLGALYHDPDLTIDHGVVC